jgi:hypothetical protein
MISGRGLHAHGVIGPEGWRESGIVCMRLRTSCLTDRPANTVRRRNFSWISLDSVRNLVAAAPAVFTRPAKRSLNATLPGAGAGAGAGCCGGSSRAVKKLLRVLGSRLSLSEFILANLARTPPHLPIPDEGSVLLRETSRLFTDISRTIEASATSSEYSATKNDLQIPCVRFSSTSEAWSCAKVRVKSSRSQPAVTSETCTLSGEPSSSIFTCHARHAAFVEGARMVMRDRGAVAVRLCALRMAARRAHRA